jgi:hypothetical protein
LTYLKSWPPEADVIVSRVDTSAHRRVVYKSIVAALPDTGQLGARAEYDHFDSCIETEGIGVSHHLVTFLGAVDQDIQVETSALCDQQMELVHVMEQDRPEILGSLRDSPYPYYVYYAITTLNYVL